MTYEEIRAQVLRSLDLDPDITGDMVDQVNDAIATILDEIVYDMCPLQLLRTAGPFNIDDTTTEIDLATDFLVTDLGEIESLSVDYKVSADAYLEEWTELSYTTYLRMRNPVSGDCRLNGRWTFTPDDTFILTNWPATSEDWDVYLNYYAVPAAITDNGEPEIPKLHHRALVLGALTMFPHLFSGDRLPLFAQFKQQWAEAKGRLLSARRATKSARALRPRVPSLPIGSINWGGGD